MALRQLKSLTPTNLNLSDEPNAYEMILKPIACEERLIIDACDWLKMCEMEVRRCCVDVSQNCQFFSGKSIRLLLPDHQFPSRSLNRSAEPLGGYTAYVVR
jgi:hypothetical protein